MNVGIKRYRSSILVVRRATASFGCIVSLATCPFVVVREWNKESFFHMQSRMPNPGANFG